MDILSYRGMALDVKIILYDELDRMDKDKIRILLNKDIQYSKSIINSVFKNCQSKLNATVETDAYINFGEALLHFLLTVAMIPSERKITINDFEVSVIIPNLKNLKSNSNALLIKFLDSKSNDYEDIISKLSLIQPDKKNIWLVSTSVLKTETSNFVISMEDFDENSCLFNFNQIIVRIDKFLKDINYTGLKIL
ncbi:MAG: hypothetical protein M3162_09835 [Thermoproteota archaeon]|nr:hypothetical protein [Thermoproteota archaeon]